MRIFIPLIWLAFSPIGQANESFNGLTLEYAMKRGDIIHISDLSPLNIKSRQPALYATNPKMLDGMELKRSLKAGQPIRISDVKHSDTVHKGDPVTLIYTSPGLRLSVEGRSLANAATGQAVRVMNLYSRRSIDAVVIGAGLAKVPTR